MAELSIAEIQANPGLATGNISLQDGSAFVFRPLSPLDGPALGRYFLSLSEATKELYGPHAFDQATADRFCAEIDYTQTVRMVAIAPKNEIIAYFILDWNVRESQMQRYAEYDLTFGPQTCCQIAPSVSDARQNQGIGNPLMRHIFDITRRAGKKHVMLTSGVYAHNVRAVHFYQKMGAFPRQAPFTHPGAAAAPATIWSPTCRDRNQFVFFGRMPLGVRSKVRLPPNNILV